MNQLELIVILALTALNVIQLTFWSWQCQKLVNKLMSKNFAEYNQVLRPLPSKIQIPPDNYEEKAVLDELNGMLNIS